MILRSGHTHLYPGHRGKIAGAASIADLPASGDCLVEFSDGSATPGRVSRTAHDWLLRTDAYRTASGTEIPGKCWQVVFEEDGGLVAFRIGQRAPR